ncbi:MAG TPA: VOC family protein [Polyangiaceae bacterium]|nr:VOC family protein [Polyangiaceae bacterium]
MTVQLNHTIVPSRDAKASAEFLSDILGLPAPRRFYHFWVVNTANGVSLDFLEVEGEIQSTHYAFLISEAEFDEIFARIEARGVPYWADPGAGLPQQINHDGGGRGIYFHDPAGHFLEIITRPYGG